MPRGKPVIDPIPDQSGLLAAEDGMLSIVSVITGFFFAILAATVANIGIAVNQKVEMQNGADAVAQSVSLQRARTLNALTASNHLSGELIALVALHEAIGAEPNLPTADTKALDNKLNALDKAHDLAKPLAEAEGLRTAKPAIGDVKKSVNVRYALLDGYKSLKQLTVDIYTIKVLGEALAALKPVPYVGPVLFGIGVAVYYAVTAIEEIVFVEWEALKGIEELARDTTSVRETIYEAAPNLRAYAKGVLDEMPSVILQTARAVGGKHRVEATIFPDKPTLNLKPETTPIDINVAAIKKNPDALNSGRTPVFARSQIVRASYPWVNYHRQPVLTWTQWMVLSQFGHAYLKWTKAISLTRPAEYYKASDNNRLYVIADLDVLRKGTEPWTQNARLADQNFCTVGLAYRKAPGRLAAPFFPGSNPKGTVTYAQAMVYNANAQNPGSRYPLQPEVGWDTLNWISPVGGSRAAEWPAFARSSGCPRIRLNWQAKLVPASRMPDAVNEVGAPFAPVLRGIDPYSSLTTGH